VEKRQGKRSPSEKKGKKRVKVGRRGEEKGCMTSPFFSTKRKKVKERKREGRKRGE